MVCPCDAVPKERSVRLILGTTPPPDATRGRDRDSRELLARLDVTPKGVEPEVSTIGVSPPLHRQLAQSTCAIDADRDIDSIISDRYRDGGVRIVDTHPRSTHLWCQGLRGPCNGLGSEPARCAAIDVRPDTPGHREEAPQAELERPTTLPVRVSSSEDEGWITDARLPDEPVPGAKYLTRLERHPPLEFDQSFHVEEHGCSQGSAGSDRVGEEPTGCWRELVYVCGVECGDRVEGAGKVVPRLGALDGK